MVARPVSVDSSGFSQQNYFGELGSGAVSQTRGKRGGESGVSDRCVVRIINQV